MAKVILFKKLRGKIKEVFDTQEAFAEAMGFSKTALYKRLQDEVEWKMCEVAKACDLLGIPFAEAPVYFNPQSIDSKTEANV